ncbi:hypothetical protein HHK36_008723 [Tetracentron sinense]|uniref:Peptidase A1 domain-containing protein n=1 Tax=Tetracentron sinense TaxID=13715 RepID=A0A835DK90_TETSI|nr:hypothetical protein HHK36_008723 [Tetracentron sinense]
MDKVSVPSILASGGLVADSFSMCFGPDGIGRISFGDKGSPDQEETPFNLNQLHPTYNVSVTQIAVGTKVKDTDFSAIFDSGTSFTYLTDPAYTRISESFNSQALDNRHSSDPRIPFEYCYDFSMNATEPVIPSINLTMKGGNQFSVYDPIVFISSKTETVYCLGVVKSSDVDIIGQNFMTDHRIVFDREKLVLGWKKSDCYDIENFSTLPVSPGISPAVPPTIAVVPVSPQISPAVPPTSAVAPRSYTPEATKESGNGSHISGAAPPSMSHAPRLSPMSFIFMIPFSVIVSSFFPRAPSY